MRETNFYFFSGLGEIDWHVSSLFKENHADGGLLIYLRRVMQGMGGLLINQ